MTSWPLSGSFGTVLGDLPLDSMLEHRDHPQDPLRDSLCTLIWTALGTPFNRNPPRDPPHDPLTNPLTPRNPLGTTPPDPHPRMISFLFI